LLNFAWLVGLPMQRYFSLAAFVARITMQRIAIALVAAIGFAVGGAAHGQTAEPVGTTNASAADGAGISNKSPALTGERRPLYRLRKSDVVEIRFAFSPEFNQDITVLPDGFVSLRSAEDVYAEGLTVTELRDLIRHAYAGILRDPDVSVVLKDFEKPFFLAAGQVTRPGRYELRAPTTVAEAIAIAGGFTEGAKHSQVIVFRKILDGVVETHVLNVKSMLASRNLEEDVELRPGDMLFVPQNRISKLKKFLPSSTLSTFLTPTQF
jgi:polysaccharide export outer membrane protein